MARSEHAPHSESRRAVILLLALIALVCLYLTTDPNNFIHPHISYATPIPHLEVIPHEDDVEGFTEDLPSTIPTIPPLPPAQPTLIPPIVADPGFQIAESLPAVTTLSTNELLESNGAPITIEQVIAQIDATFVTDPNGNKIAQRFKDVAEAETADGNFIIHWNITENPGGERNGYISIGTPDGYHTMTAQASGKDIFPDIYTESNGVQREDMNPLAFLQLCKDLFGIRSNFRTSWKPYTQYDRNYAIFTDALAQLNELTPTGISDAALLTPDGQYARAYFEAPTIFVPVYGVEGPINDIRTGGDINGYFTPITPP